MVVTTIGFGDMTSLTTLGRSLTMTLGFLGIAVFGMVIAIIMEGFAQNAKKAQAEVVELDKIIKKHKVEGRTRFAQLQSARVIYYGELEDKALAAAEKEQAKKKKA